MAGLTDPSDAANAKAMALERYQKVMEKHGERMVSCSDDFTMFLWDPSKDKKVCLHIIRIACLAGELLSSTDGHLVIYLGLLADASHDRSPTAGHRCEILA